MTKRVAGDRWRGGSGPQEGPVGTGYHRQEDGRDDQRPETRGELGIGGQRHPRGSSRDPARQGGRTKEEAHG